MNSTTLSPILIAELIAVGRIFKEIPHLVSRGIHRLLEKAHPSNPSAIQEEPGLNEKIILNPQILSAETEEKLFKPTIPLFRLRALTQVRNKCLKDNKESKDAYRTEKIHGNRAT
jgi:hypothetical protein